MNSFGKNPKNMSSGGKTKMRKNSLIRIVLFIRFSITHRDYSYNTHMKNLPINEVLEDVKNTLSTNVTLLLQAPPGAGKSTLIPISLLDEPWLGDKMILMLEPRRIAARMVATQMAKLLGEELGQRVGYQVKMQSCYTQKTKILVVTEAILVRMLQADEMLQNIALIIFDEFHERSIYSDLSLALSLQVQEFLREDLKILIMSATLNSDEILNLLGDVPVITSRGKSYDVQNIYLPVHIKQPDLKSLNTMLLSTTLRAIKEDAGDILIFLPGVKEIRALQNVLEDSLKNDDVLLLPLHSSLSKQEQDKALEYSSKRKIILSTNIAQTSLTLEGVKVVIDSGLEKLSRYNHATAMNHLEISFISKDSAIQRAGRAGRISEGKCYRLWHVEKVLLQSTKPEILRSDLSSLLLDLAMWGVEDFEELKWLDIPHAKSVQESKEVLRELQMLDDSHKITVFGKEALNLGLHPRFAYMILKANAMDYAHEACLLSALLGEKDILKNSMRDSDIFLRFVHLYERDFDSKYINIYAAKEVLKQADFFYSKLKGIQKVHPKNTVLEQEMVAVLLLLAYPDRLAKQRGKNENRYKLSNAKGAILHMEDSLFNQRFLVVPNLNANEKESFISLCAGISLESVEKYFSHLIKQKESISYNKQNKKFDIKESRHFLELELYSKPVEQSDKHDFTKLILELIQKEGLELLSWSQKAIALKNRVNFINAHTQLGFEDFSDKHLLQTLDFWLKPYLENVTTLKGLENLDMYPILLSLISWENQQLLEMLAPPFFQVPSGSNIHIEYSDFEKPFLSVKIQEVFGMYETPKILNNSISLQIHLLTPAMRPIQITYDLKSFWENSYCEVRKELRGKYKRHYWPQDPYEAVATAKTKKHMAVFS